MSKFKPATRAEFDEFVRSYPRKLVRNTFYACEPPLTTWNDFELAPAWPDSAVATASGDACQVLADLAGTLSAPAPQASALKGPAPSAAIGWSVSFQGQWPTAATTAPEAPAAR